MTNSTSPVRRRAVTLVEVVLVLVILSLIAAATWPSLERSLADQRLRNAADLVRAEWSSARAKAMQSGVDYQFHYKLEDQTFWIQACGEDSGLSDGLDVAFDSEATSNTEILPEKVFFHQGAVQTDCSEMTSGQMPGDEEVEPGLMENGESGAPIVFHSDGTCSSARLVLRNEYSRGITVTVRGLTGMSEALDITGIEEQSL